MMRSFTMKTTMVAAAALALNACATDGQTTMAQGCGVGVAAGAALGYLISGGDTEATLAGAALGGAAGCLYANEIRKRKANYASTEAYYDGQIQVASQMNQSLTTANANLMTRNAERATQIAALEADAKAGRKDQAQLAAKKSEVAQEVATLNEAIKAAKTEIGINEQAVAEINKAGTGTERVAALTSEIDKLKAHVSTMEGELSTLAAQDATLGAYIS